MVDGTGVEVAIFDTWPMDNGPDNHPRGGPADKPLARIQRFQQQRFPGDATAPPANRANPRLGDAASGRLVAPERIFDYVSGPAQEVIPCRRLGCALTHEAAYDMSDHGLFVANVIKDIAPEAQLTVYRVLAGTGLGDLETIVQAAQDAFINRVSGKNLILNLSLGLGPQLAMVRECMENAVPYFIDARQWPERLAACARPESDDAQRLQLDDLERQGLFDRQTMTFRRELHVLNYFFSLAGGTDVLVAAAGNDSCRSERLFLPRMPAAVEGLLGVSARDSVAAPFAGYSNADDLEPGRDDGVSARGALVSLAVADGLPPDGPPGSNTTGWAAWAGTSFAAPIAAGLAACIWSAALGLPGSVPPPPPGTQPARNLLTLVVGPPQLGRHIALDQI